MWSGRVETVHAAVDGGHVDAAEAVAFAESIGYKGLYTIEVNPDPAIRIVYNTILANIA